MELGTIGCDLGCTVVVCAHHACSPLQLDYEDYKINGNLRFIVQRVLEHREDQPKCRQRARVCVCVCTQECIITLPMSCTYIVHMYSSPHVLHSLFLLTSPPPSAAFIQKVVLSSAWGPGFLLSVQDVI